LFLGCEKQQTEQQSSDIPPAKREIIRTTGEVVAGRLLSNLKKELLHAMQSGGPENAIEVCKTRALQISEQLADSVEIPVDIKRASFNYRNPMNAPDAYEKRALEYFSAEPSGEQSSAYYIQRVSIDGKPAYDYYKPLHVQGLCLTCHGDPETMVPGVLDKINRLYPADKAKGYALNDFRGVVRVRIPDEKL
jgi:hypothetical protein